MVVGGAETPRCLVGGGGIERKLGRVAVAAAAQIDGRRGRDRCADTVSVDANEALYVAMPLSSVVTSTAPMKRRRLTMSAAIGGSGRKEFEPVRLIGEIRLQSALHRHFTRTVGRHVFNHRRVLKIVSVGVTVVGIVGRDPVVTGGCRQIDTALAIAIVNLIAQDRDAARAIVDENT